MTLAALLLAGGESRRMGKEKALLTISDRPLWSRQLDILRALKPAALYVSARKAPEWLPEDARFIQDLAEGRGPLAGIAAGLAAMNSTHLLALPVDMPAMETRHLAQIVNASEPRCGAAPWIEQRPEWLPAVYPVEALPTALEILSSPDVSLRAFTETLHGLGLMKKLTVPAGDARFYANCNTPADWNRHIAGVPWR